MLFPCCFLVVFLGQVEQLFAFPLACEFAAKWVATVKSTPLACDANFIEGLF
jgi:hypothetical protein